MSSDRARDLRGGPWETVETDSDPNSNPDSNAYSHPTPTPTPTPTPSPTPTPGTISVTWDPPPQVASYVLVQLDKGDSGGLMPRGQAPIIAGIANAHYTGLLECGHTVRAAVATPGDSIQIKDGYIAISATPV